jgi:hypothetical protein
LNASADYQILLGYVNTYNKSNKLSQIKTDTLIHALNFSIYSVSHSFCFLSIFPTVRNEYIYGIVCLQFETKNFYTWCKLIRYDYLRQVFTLTFFNNDYKLKLTNFFGDKPRRNSLMYCMFMYHVISIRSIFRKKRGLIKRFNL